MARGESRDDVLDRLLALFRERGYDGASLADVAAATGLGKSSLYHHFPGGKEEMALAVLDRLARVLDATVLEALRGPADPVERLDGGLAALDAFYAGGRAACLLERLVASVDRSRFAAPLAGMFAGWIGALADVAEAGGVCAADARDRAEDAVARIEGALVLAAGTGDPGALGRALARIRRDLLA